MVCSETGSGVVAPAVRQHLHTALQRTTHRGGEAQHIDHDDDGPGGKCLHALHAPVEPVGETELGAELRSSGPVGALEFAYHWSQCMMGSSGRRLAGLKSVPMV